MTRIDPNVQPNMGNGVCIFKVNYSEPYFDHRAFYIRFISKPGLAPSTALPQRVVAEDQASYSLCSARLSSWLLNLGMVTNVTTRNVRLDRVDLPLHIYQTNGGHSWVIEDGCSGFLPFMPLFLSGDAPSQLNFSNLNFLNWSGNTRSTRRKCQNRLDHRLDWRSLTVVDIECSPVSGCRNITFRDFDVTIPDNQTATLICKNVDGLSGLNGSYIKRFV